MVPSSNLSGGKQALRQAAMRRRDDLAANLRGQAEMKIREFGIELLARLGASVVAGYHPFRSELDILPLLESLRAQGCNIALPHTPREEAPLIFRQWPAGSALRKGGFGIMEPGADMPQLEPDVVFVPLLSFDAAGHRLGYGGGYYDRTLKVIRRHRTVVAIGVAFDEQKTKTLLVEHHDQPLDWILTQSGSRKFKG